jgi:cytoskeletal protein RodZ
MRKYDKMTLKVAERIFENGDKILEQRKKRVAKIRHISYAISGLCAAVIVCVGVWHFSSSMKMPNENFHGSEIISATEPAATETNTSNVIEHTTTQTAIITTKTETATQTTATTSNATRTEAVLQTTKVPQTTKVLQTTVHIQTTADNVQTTSATNVSEVTVTTAEGAANVTQTVKSTQLVTYPNSATATVSTSNVTTITNLNSFFMDSTATLVINDNNDPIFYEKRNEIISKDLIEGFIFAYYVQITKPDEVIPTEYKLPVFRISDVNENEAVAVRTPDTYEYYLFRNMDYKKEDA